MSYRVVFRLAALALAACAASTLHAGPAVPTANAPATVLAVAPAGEAATPDAFKAQQLGYMQKIGSLDPAIAERVAPLNARSDQKAVARYMAEDAGADFRPVLKNARLPILEISPYNAPDFSQGPMKMSEQQKAAYYASLLADAPDAKVISIGPSRHYVMLDQPVAFQKALADFIQTH